MPKYSEIQKHCEESSKLSKAVIDNFLINFTAAKEKLEPQMYASIKKYKRVSSELQASYLNFMKSEYIAHKIFKKGGFIEKYLKRTEIKSLPPQEFQFLEFQSRYPWRFSFAKIKNKPAKAFFEMEDVITAESYLLYSPGIHDTEEEQHPRIWFNLIGYNGKCWQTYGLIIPFMSFTTDDIFFFATELNPKIESEEMLMSEVENNPFPFFMLLSASNIPVVVSREHEVLYCYSSDILEKFSTEKLSSKFIVAWNKNVYQLKLKGHDQIPHFAEAYYDEKHQELVRTAMTLNGFESLTLALDKAGYELNVEADIIVSPGMLSITEKILGKHLEVNPFEKLFDKSQGKGESEDLNRMNHFLKLALPYCNANKEINIKELARQTGLDEETATAMWKQVKENIDTKRN
jgi:hypothetical protein